MLRASALLYSVVFSIVILIITFFIISSIYDSQVSVIKLKRIERANDNMESALAILLNNDNITGTSVDLFKDGTDIAYVNSFKWGLCDVKSIMCIVGKDTIRKAFILGYATDKNYAVNITASDRILNVAGRTLIKGNAYIPNGTFKRAYIEGRGSLSSSPVEGFIKPSPYALSIDMAKIKQDVSAFLAANVNEQQDGGSEVTVKSFVGQPVMFFSPSAITLGNETFKGQYIFKSATKINVGRSASLEDVILIAPNIEIEDGFTGVLQCFASNKLSVGKRVNLKYPSSLCLLPVTTADSACTIFLGDDSKMAGTIMAFSGKTYEHKTLVSMGKDAKLWGQIFCEGLSQVQGSIYGNVQTGSFYLKTSSAVYDNTLLDSEINCKDMNANYWSFFNTKQSGKQIIKWLY